MCVCAGDCPCDLSEFWQLSTDEMMEKYSQADLILTAVFVYLVLVWMLYMMYEVICKDYCIKDCCPRFLDEEPMKEQPSFVTLELPACECCNLPPRNKAAKTSGGDKSQGYGFIV